MKARAQTELASDLVVAAQQDFITLVALDPTDTLAISTLADLRRTIGAANITSYAAASTGAPPIVVKLKRLGGIFTVPVEINSQLTLDFTVDSGASDVTIPADVLSTLTRTGTVEGADFTGKKTYQTADGRAVDAPTLKLRALKLGNETFRNIDASVTPVEGDLLLGQTFLSQFQSWSINNDEQALILVPRPDVGVGQ